MEKLTVKPILFSILLLSLCNFSYPQSPGGISGATTWFETNNGLSTTVVSGNNCVTQWANLGSFSFGSPNVLMPGFWGTGSNTLYQKYLQVNNSGSNCFNYNPIILWNNVAGAPTQLSLGSASAITTPSGYPYNALPIGTNQGSIFAVGTASDQLISIAGTIPSSSSCGSNWCNTGTRSSSVEAYSSTLTYPTSSYNHIGVSQNIFSEQYAITNKSFGSVNRSQASVAANTFTTLKSLNYVYSIGSFPGYTYPNGGKVAEVITYNTQLTQAQAIQIESYLAIKYGITLDPAGLSSTTVGYVNSWGSNIYSQGADGTIFWNNIIGIARDSISGGGALYQRQSHQVDDSTRLYLGTLAVNNITNTSSFTNNLSHIVMGNNNGNLCSSKGANINQHPASAPVRLDREWKIQITGSTVTTNVPDDFNMDVSLSSCAWGSNASHASIANPAALGLLVNNTSNLTIGTFIPNFSIYSGKIMSLSWNSANGTITINNLNAGLMSYLKSANLNASSTPLYFTIAALDPSILPLTFTSFSAIATNNNEVDIQWDIASESGISSYTIQRSIDGINWGNLQTVVAINGNEEAQLYQEYDKSPISGTSFYRIQVNEYSGAISYSNVQEVSFNKTDQFSIDNIVPNPFLSNITITASLPNDGNISISLMDIFGKKINSLNLIGRKGMNTINMNDLNNLSSGTYVVEAIYNNQRLLKKIVKFK